MRWLPVALAASALGALALPVPAFGHSLIGRVESPLPLAVYLAGAGLAVALSFAFVLLRDVRASPVTATRTVTVPAWLPPAVRTLGLLAWLWIVAQAIVGGSSTAEVGSLFLWVYGWVGLALVSALLGPVWSWLDPFSTIHDLLAAAARRLGIRPWRPAPYPDRLAEWPAVGGFAFFVWLELVYPFLPLGVTLILYTFLTQLAMAHFGRDTWRERGETFSVWFATLGRLAPLAWAEQPGGRRLAVRPLAAGLLEGQWTVSRVVLVALGIGSIIYDGLSQTEPFFSLFGLPDVPRATFLLAGFLGLVAALVVGVGRLVGLAAIGAGLVPIAVGYLVAHYFTYLLGDGQRIIVALSDPLQQGWDLFGTAFYEPSLTWIPPGLIWALQLAAVVGGHMIGAWAGHAVAARAANRARDVRLRQIPLAALMVALTVTTLWSLGQAIVQSPAQ